MRGGALEPPTTEDLVRDPSLLPGLPTDRFPAQRTALGAATVELPPRCRRGDERCVPALVGVRLVEHPLAPPAASALSAQQWRRVRLVVTGVVFVLLTVFGVHIGLQGAAAPVAVSPGERAGAASTSAPARPAAPPVRPPSAGHATAGRPGASAHMRVADRSGPPAGIR